MSDTSKTTLTPEHRSEETVPPSAAARNSAESLQASVAVRADITGVLAEVTESLRKRAEQELAELKLPVNPENVEAVIMQMQTPQIPAGYDDVVKNLHSPDELKKAMEAKGVKSIVHSEGPTVWDHVKLAISLVEADSDIKLLMLYHDLGKSAVWNNDTNIAATRKKSAKGELQQSMIGHAEANSQKIEAGLKANGATDSQLKAFMMVVRNHMQTSILEQDVKKTAVLVDSFGENEEERRTVVELLARVLECDGNASEHVALEKGELKYSKNEKKLSISADAIWAKYKEGQAAVAAAAAVEAKKRAENEQEAAIFGGKLSDYLAARGVKPGPAMGNVMKLVKTMIQQNAGKSPEEIRAMVDALSF